MDKASLWHKNAKTDLTFPTSAHIQYKGRKSYLDHWSGLWELMLNMIFENIIVLQLSATREENQKKVVC